MAVQALIEMADAEFRSLTGRVWTSGFGLQASGSDPESFPEVGGLRPTALAASFF